MRLIGLAFLHTCRGESSLQILHGDNRYIVTPPYSLPAHTLALPYCQQCQAAVTCQGEQAVHGLDLCAPAKRE